MADPRFFQRSGPFALGELAAAAGITLEKGADKSISDVAPLGEAGGDELTFFDNRKYRSALADTRAAACVIRPADAGLLPDHVTALVTEEPYLAYARIAKRFYPAPAPEHDVSAGALVDDQATLGNPVSVAPGAVIDAGAEIEPEVTIGANAVIGKGVKVGRGTRIAAGATLSHCIVGQRCIIHPGVRIGQDGFGFAMGAAHEKVPQLGGVVIGDDVEIGANSTVDRGSGPDTVIGNGCKIDNLVMIAHNVRLGDHCIVVAQSGISGSTTLEHHVIVAAQCGITGHLTIGAGARLSARTAVIRDIKGGQDYGGAPAIPMEEFRRQIVAVRRLGRR
ncbi:MAG: UDP-3-O-(3-hydroxymyristoyl)glucosamine N-acyltransferase [Geminicoccaceae bacterium]